MTASRQFEQENESAPEFSSHRALHRGLVSRKIMEIARPIIRMS
jgi:hypothetical protein